MNNKNYIDMVKNHNIMYNTSEWMNNGNRIELGEIENTIKEIKEIEQCAVINGENEKGKKYLICYYIMKNQTEYNGSQGKKIREYLKNKLPIYMIPNYFKLISKLPINRNGKLDRKALPEIDDIVVEKYVKPENEIEEKICEMFSKIFNLDKNKIGRTQDFLELGGDSLQTIRLTSLVEKEFMVKIYMKDILLHIVIYELGQFIENKINNDSGNENENKDLIKIKKLDIEKIKDGFNELFKKQDILKNKYMEKDINDKTEIYGIIDDECSLIFEEYNYDNTLSFVRPFDLSKAPLIRLGFIKNEVLLIDIHHIISDGTSMSIIVNEINKYYNGLLSSELEVQFSDYAIHMNEMKNSEWYSKQLQFYK
ncbi:acetyl-CoA synthetase-like protein [Anaeromyces robustus]|uniref:Acetyl-CoA synthetase-like protein n=1 Tax=Anaeromyces robustus TaxID=1754192 RepID=A0A1Y1XKA5_9FUNG|nr:acetyl-CoA synthetase-like protein [Anaeromyces robustus]|eukprot:ORX86145.1 acetyl-CoA synthetase-like protein [Anaeromyces robustus]